MESVELIQRIWSQDPPYDLQGRVLDRAHQGRDHSGARRRLHAEAVPAGRTADLDLAREPEFADRAHRRAQGLGHHLGQHHPDLLGGDALGPATARPAREPASRRAASNWRVARNVMVAPTDAEARDHVFGEQGSNRYFYTYMREVLAAVGLLVILKPRPTCRTRRRPSRPSPRRRDLRLAQDRARQARRLPRAGRPVRHLADDRARLGRPNAGLGAPIDAAAGAGGDAEIPPARHGAGGG